MISAMLTKFDVHDAQIKIKNIIIMIFNYIKDRQKKFHEK